MIEDILRLRDVEGLKWPEIGAQLGIRQDVARGLYRRHNKVTVERIVTPPGGGYAAPPRLPTKHPVGWEPGVVLEGTKGTVSSGPTERNPDWDGILVHFGFDPELFEILEPVNVRTWDAAIGGGEIRQMWYHKANIRRRRSVDDRVDVEALAQEIREHVPYDLSEPNGDRGFVIADTDWQLGKRDGDGTNGVVRRVMASNDSIISRIEELRATGRKLRSGWYNTLGDLVEGCDGHYDMQTFGVELDRRGQTKVARHLVKHRIKTLAPYFEEFTVTCAPGNHGENRKDGKAFTTFGDNDDVSVIEQVAEVFEGREGYGHVKFVIPREELSLTFDIEGTRTTIAHGHQAKGGTTPEQRVENWWKNQAFGFQPAIDSALLITSHYHHLAIKRNSGRTHIQCPAMESESTWFKETSGVVGVPGVLTLVVGGGDWQDLQVV